MTDQPRREEWKLPGGTLTLLPAWGRMIQATVDDHEAFWTNPSWDGAQWNAGGDRLWLGPEQNWFWTTRNSHDPATAVVQPAIDPGEWVIVEESAGYCRLRHQVSVRHLHVDQTAVFDVTRSFSALDLDLPAFTAHIAYRTVATLAILDGPVGEAVSLWASAQVPSGGVIEFPDVGPDEYRDYFEPVGPDHLSHSGEALVLRISGTSRHKIGIPPWAGNGSMAYSRSVGGGRLVVFRHLDRRPWLDYCDRPQHVSAGAGDAVQAYNDGGQFGGFGEVEHHSPAATIGAAGDGLRDDSLTVVGIVPDEQWPEWRETWLLGSGPAIAPDAWTR